ncbi:hypothetical protein INR49_015607 [Caranx melampygus]|nr:hypothetical protein INR49_015607 [Caranx melampygus]
MEPEDEGVPGRTASSWGLILLFYIIFYIFLAGLFSLTMYVMLQTLDDHKPTWQDRLTTPGAAANDTKCMSLGMVIRPKADETYEIVYNPHKTESWDMYTELLDKFLGVNYNNTAQAQKNHECTPDQYFIQDDSGDVKNNPKRSCQFNRTILEDCSGLDDRYYGYPSGKPCIIIKLNRVIGMLPGKNGQAPYVTCGAKKEDTDKIGELMYFPPDGSFNLMYYPYYGKKAQVNYSQPLVAVKFLNITQNEDVNIECKINANNIPTGNERDKFAGRVSFKLRINTHAIFLQGFLRPVINLSSGLNHSVQHHAQLLLVLHTHQPEEETPFWHGDEGHLGSPAYKPRVVICQGALIGLSTQVGGTPEPPCHWRLTQLFQEELEPKQSTMETQKSPASRVCLVVEVYHALF